VTELLSSPSSRASPTGPNANPNKLMAAPLSAVRNAATPERTVAAPITFATAHASIGMRTCAATRTAHRYSSPSSDFTLIHADTAATAGGYMEYMLSLEMKGRVPSQGTRADRRSGPVAGKDVGAGAPAQRSRPARAVWRQRALRVDPTQRWPLRSHRAA
jgi:hypothetical protein